MRGNRMSKFAIFIGTWNTTGEIRAIGKEGAAVLSATDTYSWLPGNHFILHAADARMGDSVARSTEIIGYDEQKRRFLARAYDDQGGSQVFDVDLRGKKWSIRSPTLRFSGEFDRNGDRLTGLWEMKSGKGRWQPWIDLQLVRA
jgi:hypothetical protein